jgi:hypothetical protein
LNIRHGRQNGTRAMVEVILLGREHGYERLEQTIERRSSWAVRMSPPFVIYCSLLGWNANSPSQSARPPSRNNDRPMLPLTNYDALLTGIEVVA